MVTLTRSLLSDLYSHLFGEALPSHLLFGVRGAVPSSPGSLTLVPRQQHIDQYDDSIGYMASGNGRAYQGSVDPGLYFTLHPMVGEGCAHVMEGRYPFRKGPHKREPRAWKGIDVHCWRDRNRNGFQDPTERQLFVVHTSIDLHYGGFNTVGEFSAGCQVVRQPHWEEYRDLTYQLFADRVEYWLIDYHALSESQGSQPSLSVAINEVLLPKTCPLWISQQLHVVTVARDFLASLLLDGQPVEFTYQPNPPALVFAGGKKVAGKIVNNRLVCEVAALLRTLDPEAGVQWNAGLKRVTVTSTRLRAITPSPQPIDRLPEADDETPIPDPP